MPKRLKFNQKRRSQRRHSSINPFDSVRIRSPTAEVKLFPQSGSSAFFNAAAGQYMTDLTVVTQGASGAQRIGDVLQLQKLLIRCVINNGVGVTAPVRNISRIFFFQYYGDSSVAGKPTIADFLQVSTNNVGNTYGSFSTYDIDYARQYKVLYDSGLILTVGTNQIAPIGVPQIGVFREYNINVPLQKAQREIAFYTGGNTGPNHIFMLVTGDQQTIATNPSFEWTAELRFTDT